MKAADATGSILKGLRAANIFGKRLFARPLAWLVVAAVALIAAGVGGWLWPRQQFDMVKTLAYLAELKRRWGGGWEQYAE